MTPTIAVIDDDPAFLTLMHDILSEEGYATLLVRSARGAVAAVQAQLPDLIVLDLRFSDAATGWEILDGLRGDAGTAAIPVIICSADCLHLRAKAAWLQQHGYRALEKPFRVDELLAALAELLAAPQERTAERRQQLAIDRARPAASRRAYGD
jgi:CheY-like chemotaxis protein